MRLKLMTRKDGAASGNLLSCHSDSFGIIHVCFGESYRDEERFRASRNDNRNAGIYKTGVGRFRLKAQKNSPLYFYSISRDEKKKGIS